MWRGAGERTAVWGLTGLGLILLAVCAGCGGVDQAGASPPTPTNSATQSAVVVSDQDVRAVCTGATPQELPAPLPGPATQLLPNDASAMVMCTKPGWDDGFRPQVAYVVTDAARVTGMVNAFNSLAATPAPTGCSEGQGAYRAVFFSATSGEVALTVSPACSTASNTTIFRVSPDAADGLVKAAVGVPGTRTVELYPPATP